MFKVLSPKGMINSEQHVTIENNKYYHMKRAIQIRYRQRKIIMGEQHVTFKKTINITT